MSFQNPSPKIEKDREIAKQDSSSVPEDVMNQLLKRLQSGRLSQLVEACQHEKTPEYVLRWLRTDPEPILSKFKKGFTPEEVITWVFSHPQSILWRFIENCPLESLSKAWFVNDSQEKNLAEGEIPDDLTINLHSSEDSHSNPEVPSSIEELFPQHEHLLDGRDSRNEDINESEEEKYSRDEEETKSQWQDYDKVNSSKPLLIGHDKLASKSTQPSTSEIPKLRISINLESDNFNGVCSDQGQKTNFNDSSVDNDNGQQLLEIEREGHMSQGSERPFPICNLEELIQPEENLDEDAAPKSKLLPKSKKIMKKKRNPDQNMEKMKLKMKSRVFEIKRARERRQERERQRGMQMQTQMPIQEQSQTLVEVQEIQLVRLLLNFEIN